MRVIPGHFEGLFMGEHDLLPVVADPGDQAKAVRRGLGNDIAAQRLVFQADQAGLIVKIGPQVFVFKSMHTVPPSSGKVFAGTGSGSLRSLGRLVPEWDKNQADSGC